MKRRTFVFDMDGVLADFILGFTTRAHLLFHTSIYSTFQQKVWGNFAGMSKHQENATWKDVQKDGTFWRCLEPLGTYNEWERLKKLCIDADVYFATNRHGIEPRHQSWMFLRSQGIESPTVVITSRKGEFCKCVNADLAIDDKADNASAIAWLSEREGGRTIPYLLARPYNEYNDLIIGSKHVVRVKTLGEFLDDCFKLV